MTRRVLVVGASRGIGKELVRQYLGDGWRVHATVRDRDSAAVPAAPEDRLRLHRLEVRDRDQLADLVAVLGPASLDVAIHNAGVYRAPRAEMMAINAEAPIRVAEALLEAGSVVEGGKVVLMTSQLGARRGREGSLGDYGDSKAALNDALRERAAEWGRKGVIAVVVHPGWVRTDMGGSSAPLGVEESATGIRELIEELTAEDHGRFWTWDGREHPW